MSSSLRNKVVSVIEVAAGRSRLVSKPQVVDVVLTKACNFACTFCRDYETEGGGVRISVEAFEKVAQQLLPTARQLSLCSGGEPYLHTRLEEMLRIARRYNPRLHVWLLSNGSILRESRLRPIIAERLVDEHGFSVDGYKAATVEAIRINMKHREVIDNIRMFLRLREEIGNGKPSVVIRYALMRSNIEELPDAIRFWGDLGVERIETGYLSLANGMSRNLSLFYHQQLAREVFNRASEVARQYPHLTLSLPRLLEEERHLLSNPARCSAPWRFVMVDTNGQILPCYRAFEAMRLPSIYYGKTSFDEIWNSENYQALRSTVNDDSATKFFDYCGTCENRYGWSHERAHLGDETWLKSIRLEEIKGPIDHRRPIRGTATIR